MNIKEWPKSEEDLLIKLAKDESISEIARRLIKSENSVIRKVKELGIELLTI